MTSIKEESSIPTSIQLNDLAARRLVKKFHRILLLVIRESSAKSIMIPEISIAIAMRLANVVWKVISGAFMTKLPLARQSL